jgi:hypothetical protein
MGHGRRSRGRHTFEAEESRVTRALARLSNKRSAGSLPGTRSLPCDDGGNRKASFSLRQKSEGLLMRRTGPSAALISPASLPALLFAPGDHYKFRATQPTNLAAGVSTVPKRISGPTGCRASTSSESNREPDARQPASFAALTVPALDIQPGTLFTQPQPTYPALPAEKRTAPSDDFRVVTGVKR